MREGRVPGAQTELAEGGKFAMDKALGSSKEPVYVMRHGRTALDPLKRSDGWLDFPLSDEGRMGIIEAQQLLKELPKPLTCIYASSLKRTTETAHIIQSGAGVDPPCVEIDDAARTWNLGKLSGSKKYPNKPIVKRYMANPDEKPDEGESLNAFRKRFMTWFKEILNEKRAGPILMVLSGSNIREISHYLAGGRDALDLDEGGLLELKPVGKTWQGTVLLGSKQDDDEPSVYGS